MMFVGLSAGASVVCSCFLCFVWVMLVGQELTAFLPSAFACSYKTIYLPLLPNFSLFPKHHTFVFETPRNTSLYIRFHLNFVKPLSFLQHTIVQLQDEDYSDSPRRRRPRRLCAGLVQRDRLDYCHHGYLHHLLVSRYSSVSNRSS